METLISFVIPCYRSENTINKVVVEIINTVSAREGYDYEIIAVNDCSPDHVGSVLRKLAEENSRIKVINFAKNMGKHAAVLAGYAVAKGEYIVDLDDDCQSPVYELWKLLDPVANDECDYATAEYSKKKESAFKSFGSNVNLWMSRILLEKPKGLRFENFSVMKKFVCEEAVNYKNPFPYIEGLVLRITKNVITVPMEQRERGDDNTSGFTFKKSMKLLVNGLTAFSVKPLRFASVFGLIFAMIGFIWGAYTVIHKLVNPETLLGYSSLLAVLLLTSGMIMMMLGMIGEYIGRIYICINDSPQYVIKDTINL
ncbi:glycosyltransferase [Anaerocolumna jejuensis]|uniref:glycosyltransferase n=1 Tax=Anaerocolumna jejuensis TaxID=259063 RepID=UPI003F7C974E